MFSKNFNTNPSSAPFLKELNDWSETDKRDFDKIVSVNGQRNFPLVFGR